MTLTVRIALLAWGALILFIATSMIRSGQFYWKSDRRTPVRRSEKPVEFWFITGFWLLAATSAIAAAIFWP